jgi:protocatechuate 3,4-dioxygenase beta subunit
MSQDPERKDVTELPSRRDALGALSALTAVPLVGLTGTAEAADAIWAEQYDAFDYAAARSCALIPKETAGPYPLLSVLDDDTMVRRNVTEGKPGVPLALTLKLVNVNKACAPISNAAVYIWCTDKDGVYSGYQQPGHDTRGETWMRGIQLSNAKGAVHFDLIYPGWYPGRITHIHFQVYLNADTGGSATATSQLAFPQSVTKTVYKSPLYVGRGLNTSVPDFAHDGVFSDGVSLQMCKMKGSVELGYSAKLMVGVAD